MLGTVLLPGTTEQNTIGTIDCSFDPGHMSRCAFITIRSDTSSALSHAIVLVPQTHTGIQYTNTGALIT